MKRRFNLLKTGCVVEMKKMEKTEKENIEWMVTILAKVENINAKNRKLKEEKAELKNACEFREDMCNVFYRGLMLYKVNLDLSDEVLEICMSKDIPLDAYDVFPDIDQTKIEKK
jgi:4-diphosphocytidyl-2C-methyl-D-erythritol kinase